MASEWRVATVKELQAEGLLLVEDGNHGEYRPRRKEFGTSGVHFIRAANMADGRVLFSTASRISDVAVARIRKGIGESCDVLLSHKGTVGKVAWVPNNSPAFVCSPQTTFWRSTDAKIEPRYLLFFLQSPNFRAQLRSFQGDTDMAPYVSLTNQRRLRVTLPPLPEQRRIANVLGALDDKIELNRKMNQTLEAMAQALFKSWFIDFDGIPDSDLVDSELGPIPRGWEVWKLIDCCSKIGSGATPRGGSKAYLDEGTNLIRSQNVHDFDFRWRGLVHISDIAADKLRGVTVQAHDVLINITGDSILRTCVVNSSLLPARVNQHVAIVRPKPFLPSEVVHLFLLSSRTKTWLLGQSSGATRKAITKGHLQELSIALPSRERLTFMGEKLRVIYDKRNANEAESRTLAALRDALLPKLISGEIRVPEAEAQVEGAL